MIEKNDLLPENLLNGKVFLFDKGLNWTSFDVVNKVKSLLKYQLNIKKIKVGHAGTLDPLASGLLMICTGKQTKQIDQYQAKRKTYTGTITLGATRPSFDKETEIDQEFPIQHIKEENILSCAKSFLGVQEQFPPIFSAIKIKGKRAYDYARNNQEVVINSKQIEIFSFGITRIELPEFDFEITSSKGTYIRTIANDFGKRLESGGYLSALRRTKNGEFSVEDAITIEDFETLIRAENKQD